MIDGDTYNRVNTRTKVHSLYHSLRALNASHSSSLPRQARRFRRRSSATLRPAWQSLPSCARKCQLRLSQSDDRLGGAGSSIVRGHEAQRRKHRSPTCPATCWRVRPSVVLVDAPARQRCAAHAPATEAAAARSRRRGAIKREKKGATSASCHSLILEIGSSSVPLCNQMWLVPTLPEPA